MLTDGTYHIVIGLLGFLLVFAGFVVAKLPVGECEVCEHCKAARVPRSTER
jgi:hypothetical protein